MEERLQKVVARVCGISRRHAEEWIREGLICVNGDIAQLGCKIDCRRDTLVVENKKINPNLLQAQTNSEVWMLNKPKGVICTHSDPFSTNTLQDLVPKPLRNQHWMFVGRLDKEKETSFTQKIGSLRFVQLQLKQSRTGQLSMSKILILLILYLMRFSRIV